VAYNLGLIYRDRKEYEVAKRWFSRALESNPKDRHAQMLLERLESDD
jgi:tetratricopeptide (TPR) repeat protein